MISPNAQGGPTRQPVLPLPAPQQRLDGLSDLLAHVDARSTLGTPRNRTQGGIAPTAATRSSACQALADAATAGSLCDPLQKTSCHVLSFDQLTGAVPTFSHTSRVGR